MSVYIDNARNPYRNMVMCHMIADTSAELLDMAYKIGVQRKWVQHAGTYREHFDVCSRKRKTAIHFGAIEITQQGYAAFVRSRQIGAQLCDLGFDIRLMGYDELRRFTLAYRVAMKDIKGKP